MILSTILGQDTEQTHNLPLSIDLSEVPLDGAWTPVCFESARIFFMLKRKRAKAIRTQTQLLPDHQRNMLPPMKDALEECDCTQCDLQDSERKLLSKSAPHRYDVKKSQNKVCHSLLLFQWLTKHVGLRQYSRWLEDDRKFRQKFLRSASFRISGLPYTWPK